jgi:hypothetical protein
LLGERDVEWVEASCVLFPNGALEVMRTGFREGAADWPRSRDDGDADDAVRSFSGR